MLLYLFLDGSRGFPAPWLSARFILSFHSLLSLVALNTKQKKLTDLDTYFLCHRNIGLHLFEFSKLARRSLNEAVHLFNHMWLHMSALC